jgi:hypothetical protein
MSEYTADELRPLHPATVPRNGTKFGNFSSVDSDGDDFAGVDSVE